MTRRFTSIYAKCGLENVPEVRVFLEAHPEMPATPNHIEKDIPR